MATEIVMPRLGWTMERGTLAEWLKPDGATVKAGEPLFTVESDKSTEEIEAEEGGILHIQPAAQPGSELAVGTLLAYLLAPDEAPPAAAPSSTLPAEGAPLPLSNGARPASNGQHEAALVPLSDHAAPAISPRARRIARELGVDWQNLSGSGRSGRIRERDIRAAAERIQAQSVPPARISPVARRVAQQAGVDLAAVAAELPGQRISEADVKAHLARGRAVEGDTVQPLSTVRRVIAQRMSQSSQATAAVTLTTEVDASELVAVRSKIKAALQGSGKAVPSYTDLLTRLVALILQEHPALNATLDGETMILHEAVHMGIAVDTAQGLLVPVIRDAQQKSIQSIAAESAELIARTQQGNARPDELRGGTFTLTNLGMFEIDAFTPIINLPECAILGIGRLVARPVVIDEEAGSIGVRTMLALSLSFDHRLVDGAPAARFLQQIKRWIENPYLWLTA